MATTVMQHINTIFYNKKDVTRDLSSKLIRLDYRDKLEHRAASLELGFEDNEALFMGSWYPAVDDTLQAYIGFDNQNLLDTGIFFVDEVSNDFNRNSQCTATIRALSVSGKNIYAEKNVKQYKDKPFANENLLKAIQEAVSDFATNIIGDMFVFNEAIPVPIYGKIQVRKTIGINDKEFLDSVNYQVDKYFADLSLSFNSQFGNYDLERELLQATGINQVISMSFVNIPILRQKEFYNKGNIIIEVV